MKRVKALLEKDDIEAQMYVRNVTETLFVFYTNYNLKWKSWTRVKKKETIWANSLMFSFLSLLNRVLYIAIIIIA